MKVLGMRLRIFELFNFQKFNYRGNLKLQSGKVFENLGLFFEVVIFLEFIIDFLL